MSIESRLGVSRRQDRAIVEHAPQNIRRFLRERLEQELGAKGALDVVGAEMDVDTSDYNSPSWVRQKLNELLAGLDWLSVYRLLEEHQPSLGRREKYESSVNEVLARCGVAYEMVDGEIRRLDETGIEFAVAGHERDTLTRMGARFSPARQQYELAVHALDAIPTRPKEAVREAVNALEAVLKIISGRNDKGSLGDYAADLVRDPASPWRGSLGAALRSLYGYSSQVPGARHAQHIDAEVSTAEAALVVRMCGAAIVYFIDTFGDQT